MSVARFIADQRTFYRVPHAVCCKWLGVSQAWFYKWAARGRRDADLAGSPEPGAVPAPGPEAEPVPDPLLDNETGPATGPVAGPVAGWVGRARRRWLDVQVRAAFEASGGTYGSPRVHDDLLAAGWAVSVNTVAFSMRRQRIVARPVRRRRGLTRPDKAAVPFPDLLCRDFTASAPNVKWVGDITEIPTAEGKLYQATVIDLYARRLLASATGPNPNAQLCQDAIKIAVAARGGKDAVAKVIFHTDRGSTYTDYGFSALCRDLGIVQSMGRVGSCFDNAAAESFFSTLEFEVLSRHDFKTREEARTVVGQWCYGFYNHRRRHSSAGRMSPIAYEKARSTTPPPAGDLTPEAA